jgi:type II secretory pathway pseudopilin PulG
MSEYPSRNRDSQSGFSIVEMLIVALVILVVVGIAVPNFMSFIHSSKLQGAGSDFTGLLQQARMRAVQSDDYYATYFSLSGTLREAYVDITKNGGTGAVSGDPLIEIANEIIPTAATSAPDTSDLQGKFLPAGSTLTVNDGASSTSPIIFNSRGLPCTSISASGGTICSSSSTYATAYWVFFQDNVTRVWEGVTVSPAGRIQKWRHDGSSWTKM